MLLIFLSTVLFSSSMPLSWPGPLAPSGTLRAEPVVTPEDCAVPALLVPGGGGKFSVEGLPVPFKLPAGLFGLVFALFAEPALPLDC
jgi:hypothetical protein